MWVLAFVSILAPVLIFIAVIREENPRRDPARLLAADQAGSTARGARGVSAG